MKMSKVVLYTIMVSSMLFFWGCTVLPEIETMNNYVPLNDYKIEKIGNYSNTYLDGQVPREVYRVYSNNKCLKWGKIITEGRPEIYFVFVDRWQDDKIMQFQKMQEEVDRASDEHILCVRECQNKSCTYDEMQKYNSEMVKQSPISNEATTPCLRYCKDKCNESMPVANNRMWPHSRSQYYPEFFTPGYSVYVFSGLSDARDYYGPVNGTQCKEYEEENRVLLALCEKKVLYRLEGNHTNIVTFCEQFAKNSE